jgi:hypothetical protein
MSVLTLAPFGMQPLGALLAGTIAASAGEAVTMSLLALLGLIFAAFMWLRVPAWRALA